MKTLSISFFIFPILIAWLVSVLVNTEDWGTYEMFAEIWIPLLAVIFGGVVGFTLVREFYLHRKQFTMKVKEMHLENVNNTFIVTDKYREVIFHYHTVIDVLLEEKSFEEVYKRKSEFLDDVEELLDDIETLALKVDRLELEIFVVYEIIGNLIIDICNHSSSKEIISKNKKVDKGIYTNLAILFKKLNIEKQKSISRG